MRAQWYVGQRVWLHQERRTKPTEATITKVGRKLASIDRYGHDWQFYMDTGYEKSNWNATAWIETDEQREARERSEAAWAVLEQHHLLRGMGCRLTAEQLEAIAAVLTESRTAAGA